MSLGPTFTGALQSLGSTIGFTIQVVSASELLGTSYALDSLASLWATMPETPPWPIDQSDPPGTIVLTAPLGSLIPLVPPWSDIALPALRTPGTLAVLHHSTP